MDIPANLDRQTGTGSFIKLWKGQQREEPPMDRETLTHVHRALGCVDPRYLEQSDRVALRKIARIATTLADDQDADADDPGFGPVIKRGDHDFERLVERIAKSERLPFPQALERASEIDPEACEDYQRAVRRGRFAG